MAHTTRHTTNATKRIQKKAVENQHKNVHICPTGIEAQRGRPKMASLAAINTRKAGMSPATTQADKSALGSQPT